MSPRASKVIVTRPDGTIEVHDAYRPNEVRRIVRAQRADPRPPWPTARRQLTCHTCTGLIALGERIRYSGYEQRHVHHHQCPAPDS